MKVDLTLDLSRDQAKQLVGAINDKIIYYTLELQGGPDLYPCFPMFRKRLKMFKAMRRQLNQKLLSYPS